jgi:Fic family protein
MYTTPSEMEPLLPGDPSGLLSELGVDLIKKSSALGATLRGGTRDSVIELLRQMNSYYSNLIEGHHTHPIAIEKALKQDYSTEPAKRALQLESLSHIRVQRMIEDRLKEDPKLNVCSTEFIQWIHREFYHSMPPEFLEVKDDEKQQAYVLRPGELRDREVAVGRHIPPTHESVPAFLQRFSSFYDPDRHTGIQKIVAAAASHHRLAWIHPFVDGNGRVARLFTHAYLIRADVDGHKLWMVSRGLARRRDEYRAALSEADEHRFNDFDGRGNLSERGLFEFCRFFLRVAIDQVEFMTQLLDPSHLDERMKAYVEKRSSIKKLDPAGIYLLIDLLYRGNIARGEAPRILNMPERTARRVVTELLSEGLITSESAKADLRLAFPTKAVGYYFPQLYPEGVEQDMDQQAIMT